MSYESRVYRILIATPSDVDEERDAITKAIQNWNNLNSFSKKIVLLPLRWETHAAPDYGTRPQEVINNAIVDNCDLLIGCFWTRIGSPTGKEESGTIEEIKRVSSSGKPVMLYFSKRGQDPSQIDLEQLRKLNEFKESIRSNSLVEEYVSIIDFNDKLARQLEIKVRELEGNKEDDKVIVNTSFISIEDGKLQAKEIEEKVVVPCLDYKEIDSQISKKKEYKEHRDSIIRECENYVGINSRRPIVFGMLNKSKFNLTDFLVEIKFSSDDEKFAVKSRGATNRNYIYYRDVCSREVMRKLSVLDNEGFIKKEDGICSFTYKDTSLQKERLKIVHPYLFVELKESAKIEFEITIYADNLFTPVKETCSIKYNVERRKVNLSEIIPDIGEFVKGSDELF